MHVGADIQQSVGVTTADLAGLLESNLGRGNAPFGDAPLPAKADGVTEAAAKSATARIMRFGFIFLFSVFCFCFPVLTEAECFACCIPSNKTACSACFIEG